MKRCEHISGGTVRQSPAYDTHRFRRTGLVRSVDGLRAVRRLRRNRVRVRANPPQENTKRNRSASSRCNSSSRSRPQSGLTTRMPTCRTHSPIQFECPATSAMSPVTSVPIPSRFSERIAATYPSLNGSFTISRTCGNPAASACCSIKRSGWAKKTGLRGTNVTRQRMCIPFSRASCSASDESLPPVQRTAAVEGGECTFE
jgi:hypothetical protein